MGRSLSEAAVWYATKGLHVFPLYGIGPDGRCECKQANCKSPGKHPALEAPRGFHSATCDVDQVRAIWAAHPNRNIGLSTGASGLGVVDIDCGPGKDGEASLLKLTTTHGTLPDSWEVITGSGGRHIYFHADNFPTGTNTCGEPHIDTRGVGGYVVAPPSRHISGEAYRWKEGRSPNDHPIADAPQWLLQATSSALSESGRSGAPRQTHIVTSPLTGLVIDGRESYLRDITCAVFRDMLNESGRAPYVAVLQARVWQVFSSKADLSDGRWTERDAAKSARYILKRYADGKLSTTAPTPQVVSDVAPASRSAFLDGEAASKRLRKLIRKYLAAFEAHVRAKRERDLWISSQKQR